jgi:hypothetical protein
VFKCLNESCEPTLNIYVPRSFQWYKEFPNPMGYDPYNRSQKIWESTGTPTPKMGAHLGMWVFILTLSQTLGLPSWPTPLQTIALVMSSRLGLRHMAFEKLQFVKSLMWCKNWATLSYNYFNIQWVQVWII